MDIKHINITIRELFEGYEDKGENGVVAFGGKLDVRPPYQREFIYNPDQKNAVIDTVENGYPLNVMYWADKEDGTFEIIDGQQRTLSICQYIDGDFAHNYVYFHSITDPKEISKYLDYKLDIYICSGTETEKLKWFETINIAGEELTAQELKNAVFCGSFVSDARRIFSKKNCAASKLSKGIVSKSTERQELLELALKWISAKEGITDIREYMSKHRHDKDASELWEYFQTVINWVKDTFNVPKRKNLLVNQDWAKWYELNKDKKFDTEALDDEIERLIKDSDVQKKNGIIPYLFTGEEKYLSLRAFSDDIKEEVYAKQEGICPKCGKHFDYNEMEGDHIEPWSKGGKTVIENCQMLCRACNRTKSSK